MTHVTATATSDTDPTCRVKIVQTIPKTVASLYQTNPTIRDLIDFWVQERRCPMGLVDELLIEGMDNAADCALWAATEPERPGAPYPEQSPPYPGQGKFNHHWYRVGHHENVDHYRDVPKDRIPDHCRKKDVSGTLNAILWLLDSWVKA